MQGNGPAARFAFTGTVRDVEHLRHLPLRIGHHRPAQRGHLFRPETGLHREQEHDAIARRRAGRHQIAQNGPLLGGTDNFGLLALHRGTPVHLISMLVR